MIKNCLHVKSYDLIHWDEYEGEFNEMHCPCSECSIKVNVLTLSEMASGDYADWEKDMSEDLIALGLTYGQVVYIDIDY